MVVTTLKPSAAKPDATPIKFCSAIPTSKYFSAQLFLNLINPAELETSQVSIIKFSILS